MQAPNAIAVLTPPGTTLVREVGSTAGWRNDPLSHSECLLRMLQKRRRVNPLLTAPWVTTKIFRFDWLHVGDQGVTPDFIGNFLHAILPVVPGNTKKEKCALLYADYEVYCEDNDVKDRLDALLPTMFEPKDGPYKMRGSAAKMRAMVPWIYKISVEMLDIRVPQHEAMRQAAYHLDQVYSALSKDHPDPTGCMKEHGIKFALQYVALHDFCNPLDDRAWRIKPKMHLFMHLTSDSSIPRLFWTYRDEDFGGTVARLARRRGNLLKCSSTSKAALEKFKVLNPMIRVR